MAQRKCGNCGKTGHTARNCTANEAERAEAKRQAELPEPTELHFSGVNPNTYMCGKERQEWPERCMGDSYARQLPICEECKIEFEEKFGFEAPKI